VLAGAKMSVGIWGRSQALLVDGIHSLSDLLSDFITLVGLRLGRQPRDNRHPYGHGKIEDLATLSIGTLLLIVAVVLAVRAVGTFLEGILPERTLWLPAVALLSIFVKEGLFRVTRREGERISSPLLMANAWHHRSDAYSSIASLAGVGLYVINPRFTWADLVAALLVTLFILHAGIKICWAATLDLADTAPPQARNEEIAGHVKKIPGVQRLREIRGRHYAQRIALDLDVQVEARLSVAEGHQIAQRVEDEILARFDDVYTVMVHIEPHEGAPAP
jgi:cation diffusion facilitator family transporter